jgi:prefoldin subunit 5
MNIKYNPNEKIDKEQEDALEFYMKKCSRLEQEVERLKEHINRLVWQLEEHD